MGALGELYERYRQDVAFFVVYIREAHPEDGWVLASNRREGIAVKDPTSLAERSGVAQACAVRVSSSIPMVVDDIDDQIARAYGGLPDRLYLIGRDGRIAYQGAEGPAGFLPDELEQAIERELAR